MNTSFFFHLAANPRRFPRILRSTFFLLATLSVAANAASPALATSPVSHAKELTIFYTGGIQGTLEPCGCNSDPLGGIDRYATEVRAAQSKSSVLVLDGGNTLFSATGLSPQKLAAAKLKARFVAERLTALGLAGAGVGSGDLAGGLNELRPPRLAANISGTPFRAGELLRRGTMSIGLLGVIDADTATGAGLTATDPVAAAEREAKRLRAQGAEIVIVVAAVDRPTSRKIARKADVDLIVLGVPSEAGMAAADHVGNTFIVSAAAELQKAGRLDLVLRPQSDGKSGPIVDAGSPESHSARRVELARNLGTLGEQLVQWKNQSGADVAFVASKQREYNAMAAEQKSLPEQWAPPASGSYFTNRLIPIRRAIPQDKQVTQAMRSLDRAIGKLNLAAAVAPPKAEDGRLRYVGDLSCGKCHKQEMKFWKTTVHAHAWRTLVDGGKQADLECVGCHVTGYGHVGGSSLGFTQKLESVQCEVCHGPGSQHVAEEGLDEPPTVHTETPESVCVQCHNEKHSDTFNYAAYLRDVLGIGHGAKARQKLGEGPTGGQLRKAAMAKALAAGKAQRKGL